MARSAIRARSVGSPVADSPGVPVRSCHIRTCACRRLSSRRFAAPSGSMLMTAAASLLRSCGQVFPAHHPATAASASRASASDRTEVSSAIMRAREGFRIPASSAAAVSGSRTSSVQARAASLSADPCPDRSTSAISSIRVACHMDGIPSGGLRVVPGQGAAADHLPHRGEHPPVTPGFLIGPPPDHAGQPGVVQARVPLARPGRRGEQPGQPGPGRRAVQHGPAAVTAAAVLVVDVPGTAAAGGWFRQPCSPPFDGSDRPVVDSNISCRRGAGAVLMNVFNLFSRAFHTRYGQTLTARYAPPWLQLLGRMPGNWKHSPFADGSLLGVQLLVGSRQWLAGEPGGDAGVEAGALRDVLVGTGQAVPDGLADSLRPGDLLVEFGELALHELPAVAGRAGAGGHEGLLLGEGEPRVAVEQGGGGAGPAPAGGGGGAP